MAAGFAAHLKGGHWGPAFPGSRRGSGLATRVGLVIVASPGSGAGAGCVIGEVAEVPVRKVIVSWQGQACALSVRRARSLAL